VALPEPRLPITVHNGEIDNIRFGHDLAQCIELIEISRRHPAVFVNPHASRPGERNPGSAKIMFANAGGGCECAGAMAFSDIRDI
jgi:hypothetical protein